MVGAASMNLQQLSINSMRKMYLIACLPQRMKLYELHACCPQDQRVGACQGSHDEGAAIDSIAL